MNIQDGMWPTILTQSEDREDPKEKISDFTKEEIGRSIASYEHFHRLPRGSGTIEMLATSSAGIAGWLEFDSTLPIDIGGGRVASGALCGLWARQALSHVQESEWELIVFTVDSGASDTVVPPSVGRGLPLVDSDKVGLEYEVANGGVVVNLGEKHAEVRTSSSAKNSFLMSFQVVDVHKPLLAVSKLVAAGNKVIFDEHDPHILLSTGEKMKMRCSGGYEVDVWVGNPGFTRQNAR